PFWKLTSTVYGRLLLRDTMILDAVCGAIVAHQFTTEPVWLVVVQPPSNAKTSILEGVLGLSEYAYLIGDLTRSSFFSAYMPREEDDDAEPSLLDRITGRIMVLLDLGP